MPVFTLNEQNTYLLSYLTMKTSLFLPSLFGANASTLLLVLLKASFESNLMEFAVPAYKIKIIKLKEGKKLEKISRTENIVGQERAKKCLSLLKCFE